MAKTTTGKPRQTAELATAGSTLGALSESLLTLADQDAEAYRALRAAFRLPASTHEEEQVRREAVQHAVRAATDVPLQIMAACGQALHVAVTVATFAPVRARSEVAVGVELLRAAFHGAGVCIVANLPAMTDAAFVADVRRDRQQLDADATDDRDAIRLVLAG
jgi:formiminotetrahydrofolate cyclodeaminase